MIVKDKRLTVPPWNKTIWRYMDLPKFLDLVTTEQLFFANCSKLTDKYEGELPQHNIDQITKRLETRFSLPRLEAEERAQKEAEIIRSYKNYTLVNCWSMYPEESYALWKIYLGGASSGVAIKTNTQKLIKAVLDERKIYIGEVKYGNYIKGEPDVFNVITQKTPFYGYEEELRLFIPNQIMFSTKEDPETGGITKIPKYPGGTKIAVNIDTLVDEIFISPFVGEWFEEVLKKTLKELRPLLLARIRRSAIQDI